LFFLKGYLIEPDGLLARRSSCAMRDRSSRDKKVQSSMTLIAGAGEDWAFDPEWQPAIALSRSFPFLMDQRNELLQARRTQLDQGKLYRASLAA
jgi:hypothetical protein